MVVDCQPDRGHARGRGGDAPRSVRRVATEAETRAWRDVADEERDAVALGQAILDRHRINVRIVHAEFQFDRRKLTFHFTSREPKPQVRTALPDLFQQWHCRVWFARHTKVAADREQRRRSGGIVPAGGQQT